MGWERNSKIFKENFKKAVWSKKPEKVDNGEEAFLKRYGRTIRGKLPDSVFVKKMKELGKIK